MRSVSALDVRKHFGQLLDEAAAGERLVIERGGQPIAALVPLSDVPELSRDARVRQRREAIAEISRLAREQPINLVESGAQIIRRQRDERAEQIWSSVETWKKSGS